MDNNALAEQMTDLYLKIDDYFERKTSGKPTMEQTNTIFIECSKHIITGMISKQRSDVPPKQEINEPLKPSEKQIAFAKKLGCDNPEGYTRLELSKWIDEHKTF